MRLCKIRLLRVEALDLVIKALKSQAPLKKMASTLDLTKAFLRCLRPDAHAACEPQLASMGKKFLIVGTKNKIIDLVVLTAIRARWYVNKLAHYRNKTSEVQGLENRTKDGGCNTSNLNPSPEQ
ncbi:hypothetical protein Gorai_017319, partial [Gossypium raimondii]|nr:hypothetical protein [Gossypium raimondii]